VNLENVIELLVFISGVVLLVIAFVFLQLYYRYKRRDYFLLTLGFFAAAVQVTVGELGELDEVVPESWGTELLEFISAVFSVIMVLTIVFVLLFPDRVPIDFAEKIAVNSTEE
jgi:hypothetical protein